MSFVESESLGFYTREVNKMNDRTKLAKSYIRGIATKKEFYKLLDELILSELERKVLIDFYINKRSLDIIASEAEYSVPTIKKVHRDALETISNYIYDSMRNIE